MVKFASVNGSARKGELDYFKFRDGSNTFRMFGDILARYVYWVPKRDGSGNVPMECLSFDREEERFTNAERDVVQENFPEINCGWAYMVLCLDPADGTIKALGLKKKMFEQILLLAEDLGDPTDPETGWTVAVNRKKTGSQAFNVEYTVEQLKCSKNVKPLTDDEKALIAEAKSIEEYFARPSVADQEAFLKRSILPEEEEENVDEDVAEDFDEAVAEEVSAEAQGVDLDDDTPF